MKVLVVEDENWRIKWFRERFPDCDVTADVDEAIGWLREREYGALFLDHDLGEKLYAGYGEPRPGVGRDVAQWLIEHPEVLPALHIVVHSMNVVSAPKIHAELLAAKRRVDRVPFTTLVGAVLIGA